jgi:hypothetical protein
MARHRIGIVRTGHAFGQGFKVPDPVMNEPAMNGPAMSQLVMNETRHERPIAKRAHHDPVVT